MQDFTKGHIGRQIIFFSIPIILGNFFMQFYQIADSVIVGKFLGKEALAAVGASMPVIFAVIALVIGIGSGASVVVSQYFGAKDTDKVNITSDTLLVFLVGSGALIGIFGYFFSEAIFRLMELPEELIPMATEYLQIYLGGIIFMFGFNTVSSILRGIGDSKTPLYFLLISSVLNILLDLLFVIQFGWGVSGAAWATVISSAIACALAIAYINRKNSYLKINILKLKFDPHIFRLCVKYGLPTGIQQSFVAYGAVALMSIVNGFGTNAIAGYTAGMRVDGLAVIPSMNFAMALSSFVGQNVGAGRYDRVKKGLRLTLIFSSITCIVITVIIILFGEQILMLFTDDIAVVIIGEEYLVIISLFYLLFNTMFIINGMLRGAGAVVFPMISTLISLWIVRLPAAVWFSSMIGVRGIWWAVPFGWGLGCILAVIYYRTGKWKSHSVFAQKQ